MRHLYPNATYITNIHVDDISRLLHKALFHNERSAPTGRFRVVITTAQISITIERKGGPRSSMRRKLNPSIKLCF